MHSLLALTMTVSILIGLVARASGVGIYEVSTWYPGIYEGQHDPIGISISQ